LFTPAVWAGNAGYTDCIVGASAASGASRHGGRDLLTDGAVLG
jgi:hypothetical protein